MGQERKVTVRRSELPAAISKAIKKALPNGRIIKIEKEVEGEDPGQYDFLVRSGGKDYEVEISPEGQVIEVKEVASAEEAPAAEQGRKWTKSFGLENRIHALIEIRLPLEVHHIPSENRSMG